MKEKNYLIYKVTNLIDSSIYIGATTKSLEVRKEDHIKKSNSNSEKPLHVAISTYGLGMFTWEMIDTASSKNELADKEINYIYEYSKTNSIYNGDRGGGIKKEVYQYHPENLNLITKYDSLKEASEINKLNYKTLSKACLSVNQFLKGYYWSYNCSENFTLNLDKRKKDVYQYTLEGKYLNSFKSVSEASKSTKINKSSIAKVCRKERSKAGGFIWCYQ